MDETLDSSILLPPPTPPLPEQLFLPEPPFLQVELDFNELLQSSTPLLPLQEEHLQDLALLDSFPLLSSPLSSFNLSSDEYSELSSLPEVFTEVISDCSSATAVLDDIHPTKSKATWTWEETKEFELALVNYYAEPSHVFAAYVTSIIPGKTTEDVKQHHLDLLEDVWGIEAGVVPVLGYAEDIIAGDEDRYQQHHHNVVQDYQSMPLAISRGPLEDWNTRGTYSTQEVINSEQLPVKKKRGKPWTEEEHRSFLRGLKEVGKGDWRGISRNYVPSRTSQQVASHAQKYFLRQKEREEGRATRRPSIHDITPI